MDGKKKRKPLFNENKIRVNEELFEEYTTRRDKCADADEEKRLLSEYTQYFVLLNRFQIEIILFRSPVTIQEDFPLDSSTTWKDIKTGQVITKQSKSPVIRYDTMTIREDLFDTFVEKEVSRLISNYEKKYNEDGTEIPFLACMCACLKRAKTRFWNIVQYYEVVKSYVWITDNFLEKDGYHVKGTKKKLTTVVDTIADFKAKHKNPSKEEIRDYFRAKKRYTPNQIDDLVEIVLSPPAFGLVQAGQSLENLAMEDLRHEQSKLTDYEEILYDVITGLLNDLREKSEENYYILSHYCDDKETIDFSDTIKIYYYKYFEARIGLDALKTSEEIANDLGGEWTPKGVEFRYQVVIEEDFNCNIMIKKSDYNGFSKDI